MVAFGRKGQCDWGFSGSDAERALLARRAFHRYSEGEGSIPVQDVGFSPLNMYYRLAGRLVRGFSPGTPVCSPSVKYLRNKNSIPSNYVIAELTLRTTWL